MYVVTTHYTKLNQSIAVHSANVTQTTEKKRMGKPPLPEVSLVSLALRVPFLNLELNQYEYQSNKQQ